MPVRRYISREDAVEEEPGTRTPAATPRRGGPRSRLVEAIAVLLLAKPMRAAEIAQVLGYSTRYISSYLSYWKSRGLFDYENGFWVLTDEGEDYARTIAEREMNSRVAQYAALAQRILSSQPVNRAINDKGEASPTLQSGRVLSFTVRDTGKTGKKRQKRSTTRKCINAILTDLEELDEDERLVMEQLLEHYAKWGSTYTYLDHLEQVLEADRVWLLKTLRLLQAKKLVYIYTDKRLGIRVGLSKRIRELLEECNAY